MAKKKVGRPQIKPSEKKVSYAFMIKKGVIKSVLGKYGKELVNEKLETIINDLYEHAE